MGGRSLGEQAHVFSLDDVPCIERTIRSFMPSQGERRTGGSSAAAEGSDRVDASGGDMSPTTARRLGSGLCTDSAKSNTVVDMRSASPHRVGRRHHRWAVPKLPARSGPWPCLEPDAAAGDWPQDMSDGRVSPGQGSSRAASLSNREAVTSSLPDVLRARAEGMDIDEVELGPLIGRGCAAQGSRTSSPKAWTQNP